jgi:hypothetical protein
MPIRKKDRTFQNIIRDVDIGNVPLDYIERLILVLENGDRVIFEGDDIRDIEEESIILFIMAAVDDLGEDYGSPVQDLEIVIDYTKLESEVRSFTEKLLDKDKNDQSDTSV